jgi:signal transduction histidine kinase
VSPNSTTTAVTTDQRIAAVLDGNRQELGARLRAGGTAGEDDGAREAERDPDQLLRCLAQAFEHGRWGSFYCRFAHPADAAHWLSRIARLLPAYLMSQPNGGELVGRVMQVVAEMTLVVTEGERSSAERAQDELRELLEIKSAFFRLTTHELRRPLGLTRGHLALLQEGTYGDVPDMMRHPLQQIAAGAHEMSNLIDGLATVVRLEDRADVLRPGPCRVSALVTDVVRAVEPEASLKSVCIDAQPPRADLEITADGERLRIAVLNLLTNAIKYAPPESTVTVQTAERHRQVAIAVADQGPGIDAADSEHVFEKYYRSGHLPDHLPGLGLGLYIVRQIVELHGGQVTLKSAPGHGSTFAILLPAD